jgi:hypothetical protein
MVNNGVDMAQKLKYLTNTYINTHNGKVGLLLSTGIDSGAIAYCLPPGTHVFFIEYDETESNEDRKTIDKYVEDNKLELHVVNINWATYQKYIPVLLKAKKAPLHPCEVPVYAACLQAKELGIQAILTGWGCDTHFGGMDKLLSHNFTSSIDISERYCYLQPSKILKNPIDVIPEFDKYMDSNGIFNTQKFLDENYHGMTIQSFFYIGGLAGLIQYTPWGRLTSMVPYDINRVRNGEPKHLIRDCFKYLTNNSVPITEKIPFTRPDYITNLDVLSNPIFRTNLDCTKFTQHQKWMIFIFCQFYDQVLSVS